MTRLADIDILPAVPRLTQADAFSLFLSGAPQGI